MMFGSNVLIRVSEKFVSASPSRILVLEFGCDSLVSGGGWSSLWDLITDWEYLYISSYLHPSMVFSDID